MKHKLNHHLWGYRILDQLNISGRAKWVGNVGIPVPSCGRTKILLDDINQELIMNENILGCYRDDYPLFHIFDY